MIVRLQMKQGAQLVAKFYLSILNYVLQKVDQDWKQVWDLLCVVSVVVMRDAPLQILFSDSYLSTMRNYPSSISEWSWPCCLLSLEGCVNIINHLISLPSPDILIQCQEISELIRLACHSITFTSQDVAIDSIQLIGLTLLQDIINRFVTLRDEDTGHSYLEQFEVQILAALRRVVFESVHETTILRSLQVVFSLVTHSVITQEDMVRQALEFLQQRPLSKSLTNTAQRHIQQEKVFLLSQLYSLSVMPLESRISKDAKRMIREYIAENKTFWRQHWFATIESILESKSPDLRYVTMYLLNAATMLEMNPPPPDGLERILFVLSCDCGYLKELLNEEDTIRCLVSLTLVTPQLRHIDNYDILCEIILFLFQLLHYVLSRYQTHSDVLLTTLMRLYDALLDLMEELDMNKRLHVDSGFFSGIHSLNEEDHQSILFNTVGTNDFVSRYLLTFSYQQDLSILETYQSEFLDRKATAESDFIDNIISSYLQERQTPSQMVTPRHQSSPVSTFRIEDSYSSDSYQFEDSKPILVRQRSPLFQEQSEESSSLETEYFSDSETTDLSIVSTQTASLSEETLSASTVNSVTLLPTLKLEPLETRSMRPWCRDPLNEVIQRRHRQFPYSPSSASLYDSDAGKPKTPKPVRNLGFHFTSKLDINEAESGNILGNETPSHLYHRSLFDYHSHLFDRHEMNDQFCQPLNFSVFCFINHVIQDYSIRQQIHCFRRLLAIYNQNEESAFLILSTYYHLWIIPAILREDTTKKQLLQFLMELIDQYPHWGETVPGEVATQLLVLLQRCTTDYQDTDEQRFTTLWTLLLLLYRMNPSEVFILILTVLSQFNRLSPQLPDQCYLSIMPTGLSGLSVLRSQDMRTLLAIRNKSILLVLTARVRVLSADALLATTKFLLSMVSYDEFSCSSNASLSMILVISLAKRCIAIQYGESQIAEKKDCKEALFGLGQILLTIAKEMGDSFKKPLGQFSAFDRTVVHHCCLLYMKRKRRERFRSRRKGDKLLTLDSSKFV